LRKIAARSPLFEGKREDFEGLKEKLEKEDQLELCFCTSVPFM
jgi:hypothetical protein